MAHIHNILDTYKKILISMKIHYTYPQDVIHKWILNKSKCMESPVSMKQTLKHDKLCRSNESGSKKTCFYL